MAAADPRPLNQQSAAPEDLVAWSSHTAVAVWPVRNIAQLMAQIPDERNPYPFIQKSGSFGWGAFQISLKVQADGIDLHLYIPCPMSQADQGEGKRRGRRITYEIRLGTADDPADEEVLEVSSDSIWTRRGGHGRGWHGFAARHAAIIERAVEKGCLFVICEASSAPPLGVPDPKTSVTLINATYDKPLVSDVVVHARPSRRRILQYGDVYAMGDCLAGGSDYFSSALEEDYIEATYTDKPIPPAFDILDGAIDDSDSDSEDEEEEPAIAVKSEHGDTSYPFTVSVPNARDTSESLLTSRQASNQRAPSTIPAKRRRMASASSDGGGDTPTGPLYRHLYFGEFCLRTVRALLFYILSGDVVFAPLRSTYRAEQLKHGDAFPFKRFRDYARAHALPFGFRDPCADFRPEPVSAKSLFRLADKLDMDDLRSGCLEAIRARLTPENCGFESMSDVSNHFKDVREICLPYFIEHFNEARDAPTLALALGTTGREDVLKELFAGLAAAQT